MKSKRDVINFVLAFGMTLCAVLGCSNSSSNNNADPGTRGPSDFEPATISIHAGKLVLEFEGNEVGANQTYGGKRVRVNGMVNSIEDPKNGRLTLTFRSPFGGYAQTRCYFDQSQSPRLAQFRGGEEAIVEGTVRGLSGGLGGRGFVELEDCVVP